MKPNGFHLRISSPYRAAHPDGIAGAFRKAKHIAGAKDGIFDLLVSQAIPLLSAISITFATAALLGPRGRGDLAFLTSTSSVIGAIGFGSLYVGVAHAHALGDRTAVRRGMCLATLTAALIATVGFSEFWLFPKFEIGLLTNERLLIVCVAGALVSLNLYVLRTLQGLGYARTFRNCWATQSLVYLLLGVPTAALTRSSVLVISCWFLGLTASTVYGLTKLLRVEPSASGPELPLSVIVSTSLAAHVGLTGQQLLYRADIIFLGFFASAASVGIYSVAVPIAELIWVASEALSLSAFGIQNHTNDALRETRRRRLVRANLIIGLLGTVVVSAAALALALVMPNYRAAVPLIFILLPGVIVQGYSRIGLSSILSSGRRRAPVLLGLSSVALSFLYIPFTLAWQATGAAVATTCIYFLQAPLVAAAIRRNRRSLQEGN